ncbi:MAG: hypothetical protein LUE93_12280 [Bacteroides sp.]|nr:hypothetical protein [Bacteroides sp.]
MSFAGHVFDMIRKNKENRDLLNLRRERAKNRSKTYLGKEDPANRPQISLEEYESKELKEWEKEKEKRSLRTTIVIAVCIVGLLVISGILVKWFLLR